MTFYGLDQYRAEDTLTLWQTQRLKWENCPSKSTRLGSPTEVMESYRYDVLADMILTAKKGLPIERPLHLFGAGHPAMFSLAVALGCDLFDSAAYALYARENRYMTENGTWRLEEMDYFPCCCPRCSAETPRELGKRSKKEREIFLAEHNLYVCQAELKRIKQAIRERQALGAHGNAGSWSSSVALSIKTTAESQMIFLKCTVQP